MDESQSLVDKIKPLQVIKNQETGTHQFTEKELTALALINKHIDHKEFINIVSGQDSLHSVLLEKVNKEHEDYLMWGKNAKNLPTPIWTQLEKESKYPIYNKGKCEIVEESKSAFPEEKIKRIKEKLEAEKYYTPSDKDFRIGYEMEVKPDPDGSWHRWSLLYFDSTYYFGEKYNIQELLSAKRVRTAYLIPEHMEKDGWRTIGTYNTGLPYDRYVKGIFELHWYPGGTARIFQVLDFFQGNVFIEFEDAMRNTIFYGYCPSINEVRYLSRILNIK